MIECAALDYWGTVRRLAAALGAPQPAPRSLVDLLNAQPASVAAAAEELGGTADETDSGGRQYVRLPVAPSASGMTWLYAPAGAGLRWPASLGVLFNFTNHYPGTRHKESLQHWSTQVDEPWLVMVEGPVNRVAMQYELKAGQAHEWEDGTAAGQRAIEEFAKRSQRVGYYFNCLLPLAFEIGLRSTMVSARRRVYHYNRRPESGAARYELAFDGWQ